VPNSIDDLRVEGAWSTTGGVSPQPFMQYDSVTGMFFPIFIQNTYCAIATK